MVQPRRRLPPGRAVRLLANALVVLLAGCAGTAVNPHLRSPDEALRACAQWYAALDHAVDAAGVRDAQDSRIPGFPYLRVSRHLSSLRDHATASEAAMRAFSERLTELDLEARRFEIDNLPEWSGPRPTALKRTGDCARLLRDADLAVAERRRELLDRASVPDDYSLGLRTLGLYPLTRIPFASGVRKYEA